ncbi:MAG: hypothetical protein WAL47_00125 [Pyrinomonadaceae bacterium]|jgi:hypothetical protein
MATYTPPPYFPQGSLAPPDASRYKRFKLAMFGLGVLLVILMGAVGIGLWYLAKWIL